jgi:threonine dehydrogenase-like Zn-dependent dehydrogenase
MDPAAAYCSNTRQDVLGGGAALFPGAAGPMGMMHVQHALQAAGPPGVVVVTDISDQRLDCARERLGPMAEEAGVAYHSINPNGVGGPAGLDGRLREISPRGYDDIVVSAPVGAVITQAARHAADGCVFNIFAGVPLGTISELSLSDVVSKRVKYTGASGSAIEDLLLVLDRVSSGDLDARMSLGAVGGMNQVLEGLMGVSDGRFSGKAVIFPWIEDLPLSEPAALAEHVPGLAERLEGGSTWSAAAEELLLESFVGKLPGLK